MPGGTDTRTDEALLRAHVDGDPEAFGVLITRHHRRLWSVAYRTSPTPEDAADALQDALLNAHRMAHRFRADARVTSWLHRIVVNACLDRVRRNRSRSTLPLNDRDSLVVADPADHISAVDLSVSIGRALHHLNADQRAAIVAVDIEGYTLADAADLLGVPIGTIKSRCSRGHARLAQLLGHLNENP